MKAKHLFFFSLLAIALIALAGTPTKSQFVQTNGVEGMIAGRNVNMLSGHDPVTKEPYDINGQRQNEPSIAVSTRNPLHLIAGANDWQPLDRDIVGEELPGVQQEVAAVDAWMGVFTSKDGGESWKNKLLPGSLVDGSTESLTSPIYGYEAAADPVWRAGAAGMFFGTGITFNRGQRGLGALFVARYIDRNNREGGDPIQYIDTKIVDEGNSGHFIDKCWLAVDVPRTTGTITLPNGDVVPRMNVFVVYTSFMGNTEAGAHGKLMISVSHDSGQTWSKPSQITDAGKPYQAASVAIDPRNGRLHIAYRRFAKDGHTDAIMLLSEKTPKKFDEEIGYTHDKLKFLKPVVVQEIAPFDQPNAPTYFRTSTYPSMTVDHNGIVYLAYAMRDVHDYSRIFISIYNPNTDTWYDPQEICLNDNLPEGPPGVRLSHMFMPTISYGAGKITLAWYDQRWDISGVYSYFINDADPYDRHTIDVRAAQSDPFPNLDFSTSIQVSKYPWLLAAYTPGGDPTIALQLQHFFPGLEIFQQGTQGFIGDYIDLAPSQPFIPDGEGGWTYNTGSIDNPVFHVVWADNRDVFGDLTGFNPPNDPDVPCDDPNQTNSRNQNIYTSRLTRGIVAGSPGNTKPLNIERAFVVFVKNTTKFPKQVDLTITSHDGANAYFVEQGVISPSLSGVDIPPYSTTARTVVVDKYLGNLYASFTINVWEKGVKVAQIALNPDPTNPEIEDPDGGTTIDDTETHTPHVGAYHVVEWNYDEANPHVGAPHVGATPPGDGEPNDNVVTPHVGAPHVGAPHVGAPHVGAPHVGATSIYAPHVGATHLDYDDIPEDSSMTDVYVGVENAGNTTSTFSIGTLPIDVPQGILVQLLVYRVHKTPFADGCNPKYEEHHELISSMTPHVGAPHVGAGRGEFRTFIQNTDIPVDVTVPIETGGKIVLCYRILDPDKYDAVRVEPRSVVPIIKQDWRDIIEGQEVPYDPQGATAPTITTTSLDRAYIGYPFSQTLEADGGYPPYTWTLEEAPQWLSLNGATLSATPQAGQEGTYEVIVKLEDDPPSGIEQYPSYRAFDFIVDYTPDLIVDSLTHAPANPIVGTEMTFVAVVKNVGDGTAPPTILEFRVGGETPGADGTLFLVPSLAPGATHTVQRQETFDVAQNYQNTATADINYEVFEEDEYNNVTIDSFTVIVPDLTPPAVTSFDPADEASGVALDTDLVITFDENVVEDTGNIDIKKTSDDSIFETIDVTDTGKVAIVDNFVTINPDGLLEDGTGYYVQIAATCFQDTAGNHYVGINDNTTWNFSTITLGDLIAYYPFNGNANDESGFCNHGTVSGAVLAQDRFNNPNSAYAFDGIDDIIEIPDSANFNFSHPITISAWIYLDDNSKGGIVGQWGYGGEGGDAFILYIRGTKLSTYLPRQGLDHYELQSNSSLATDQWYMVSMVSTGNLVTLYINGSEDKSEAVTVQQVDSYQTLEIGLEDRHSGGLNYLDGIVDEIRIYNRALAGPEIAQLSTPEFVTKWGTSGTGDGQFDQPRGMAFDSSGNVYVTDFDNHRVQKFTSSGTFITKWGNSETGDGQFNYPRGIAVDGSGDVYVTDYSSIPIQKFTSSGTFITKWGGSGSGDGHFSVPEEIAIDGSGNVYVADKNNHRIQKFNSTQTFLGWWGRDDLEYTGWHGPGSPRIGVSGTGDGQFDQPWGIAVDNSGNVYVTDSGNHRIQKFSSSGTFLAKWGSIGSGDGQLQVPLGIAVDSSGNVYVADRNNHRIQKFTSSGAFLTKWGTYGSGDGQFKFMRGVEVDTLGNIYVSDAGNDRVQKFK